MLKNTNQCYLNVKKCAAQHICDFSYFVKKPYLRNDRASGYFQSVY